MRLTLIGGPAHGKNVDAHGFADILVPLLMYPPRVEQATIASMEMACATYSGVTGVYLSTTWPRIQAWNRGGNVLPRIELFPRIAKVERFYARWRYRISRAWSALRYGDDYDR
jgi:hypothetical protein